MSSIVVFVGLSFVRRVVTSRSCHVCTFHVEHQHEQWQNKKQLHISYWEFYLGVLAFTDTQAATMALHQRELTLFVQSIVTYRLISSYDTTLKLGWQKPTRSSRNQILLYIILTWLLLLPLFYYSILRWPRNIPFNVDNIRCKWKRKSRQ